MTQNKTYGKSLLLGASLTVLAFLVSNCTHHGHHHHESAKKLTSLTHADVTLEPKSGHKKLKGNFHFMYENETLTLTGKVEGLKPNQSHGFHIHEIGDCSAADASSAGPHFSPNSKSIHSSHTDPNRHAGDLGNLKSDKNGFAEVNLTLPGLNLSEDSKEFSVLGRALVIHADPDDFVTQPAGNSGTRIGCGVIQKSKH